MELVNIEAAVDGDAILKGKGVLSQYENRRILRADNKTLKTIKIEMRIIKYLCVYHGKNLTFFSYTIGVILKIILDFCF